MKLKYLLLVNVATTVSKKGTSALFSNIFQENLQRLNGIPEYFIRNKTNYCFNCKGIPEEVRGDETFRKNSPVQISSWRIVNNKCRQSISTLCRHQSRTQSPQALWPAVTRQERLW